MADRKSIITALCKPGILVDITNQVLDQELTSDQITTILPDHTAEALSIVVVATLDHEEEAMAMVLDGMVLVVLDGVAVSVVPAVVLAVDRRLT